MLTRRRLLHSFGALGVALLLAPIACAGLPLVCHPFQTGDAKLLPWSAPAGRFTVDPYYDTDRLMLDTLHLLGPDTPIFARMENLRRAATYATINRHSANDLLKALLDRTLAHPRDPRAAALAWFDAGYLVESYRQHGLTQEIDLLDRFDTAHPGLRSSLGALNGYVLVQKAIAVTHAPEMEYAASLMTQDSVASARHRANAAAEAKEGSLLALNLEN